MKLDTMNVPKHGRITDLCKYREILFENIYHFSYLNQVCNKLINNNKMFYNEIA